jgi:hypothetical protein
VEASPVPVTPTREFAISREARDRYGLAEPIFGMRGDAILADFRAARALAARLNAARDLTRHPDRKSVV